MSIVNRAMVPLSDGNFFDASADLGFSGTIPASTAFAPYASYTVPAGKKAELTTVGLFCQTSPAAGNVALAVYVNRGAALPIFRLESMTGANASLNTSCKIRLHAGHSLILYRQNTAAFALYAQALLIIDQIDE